MYCPRCGTWAPDTEVTCANCGVALATPPAPESHAQPEPQAAPAAAHVAADPTPAAPRYAGFWRRAIAGLVDAFVFAFPNAILRVLAGLPMSFSFRAMDDTDVGRALTVSLASWMISWLYCALLESSAAQGTLGQQLLGLRVSDLPGRRISFGRASARFFAQVLSFAMCGIGYLFILWSSKRQALHDMIAGCVLVRPEPDGVHPTPAPGWAGNRP